MRNYIALALIAASASAVQLREEEAAVAEAIGEVKDQLPADFDEKDFDGLRKEFEGEFEEGEKPERDSEFRRRSCEDHT